MSSEYMTAQGVRAIIGVDGVGVRVVPLFNGHGVSAPLKLLLREVVSNSPRNEGERGKGTAVGEGGCKDRLGLETDFGEERSGKRCAGISVGISRSGVTARLPD